MSEEASTECMRAPNVAGPSSEGTQQSEQSEEMLEGDDEVNKKNS